MEVKNTPNVSFGMKIKNTQGLQTMLRHWEHKGNMGKRAIGQLGKIKKLMNDSFELEIRDIKNGSVGTRPVSYAINYNGGEIVFNGHSTDISPYHFIKDLKTLVRYAKDKMVEFKGAKSISNR